MFSGLPHASSAAAGAAQGAQAEPGKKHEVPPPTPIRFPSLLPRPPGTASPRPDGVPLRAFIRGIQRPTDIKLTHFEALGFHIIPNTPLAALLPDPSFLPPDSWAEPLPPPSESDLDDSPPTPVIPLNNGRPSPGRSIYSERIKELSIPNPAAFRTVRRLSPPHGDPAPRLGNAYEFFKNLELLSGFWVDTSLSGPEPVANDDPDTPVHQRIHIRSGNGSQTPPDFRAALLAAFVKLVAYDFSCNVSLPRVEPRLHIGPSLTPGATFPLSSPPSSFPTNISFIYRTPSDRASARGGFIEGPLAALSARHATAFEKPFDEILDLAREIAAVLVAAQQRRREGKEEVRPEPDDPAKWWCFKPRWGGGQGGPIGKEEAQALTPVPSVEDAPVASTCTKPVSAEAPEAPAIQPTPPNLLRTASAPPSKRRATRKMASLYDAYRQLRPPSSTWDRKARYQCIGRQAGTEWDDVFLVSCLNHHVSLSRCRIGKGLLEGLGADGMGGVEGAGGESRGDSEGATIWRSKWWDLFLVEERVEAMRAIWGMMAWLMRAVEEENGGVAMEGVEGGSG